MLNENIIIYKVRLSWVQGHQSQSNSNISQRYSVRLIFLFELNAVAIIKIVAARSFI